MSKPKMAKEDEERKMTPYIHRQMRDLREDDRIRTIRRYVEGLGGKLEITAVFKDERVSI
jgi:hypothetical protein